jgi:regulatory protein
VADPDSSDPLVESPEEPARGSLVPARNRAMNFLARREHSRAELRVKLAVREYSPEDIEAAIKGLVADGLVSDERFAECFIVSRQRKGQGPVRIRMELKKRGVDSATIRLYLDDVVHDWNTLARKVRNRKFGEVVPAEFKEKARQMRFLEYRGFTSEQISAAMGGF